MIFGVKIFRTIGQIPDAVTAQRAMEILANPMRPVHCPDP